MKHLLLLSFLIIFTNACVERRMRIVSDPPEATVYIDGEKIGKTPTEHSFDFYGTREVTLVKKGYYISSHKEAIIAPAFQTFPLDFFVDIIYPFTVEDNHNFYYTLKPHIPLPKQEKESLLERAEDYRKESP